MNQSFVATRAKPSYTMKNTAILTLTEYKSIKQRMSVGGVSGDQERRQIEVSFISKRHEY